MASTHRIRAVLIDVNGTLIDGDHSTPGAIEALNTLCQRNDITVRILTNTSKESTQTLYDRLHGIGFRLPRTTDICTSLTATAEYVRTHALRPYYILSDDACREFDAMPTDPIDCTAVVVGLAPEQLNYERLSIAFNILMEKRCPLLAVHEGRYVKRGAGMALGPGCFTRGLEYAADCTALVIGKPHPHFFRVAMPTGLEAHECVMIGDEVRIDIDGALAVGMKAILVQTGKYRSQDRLLTGKCVPNLAVSFAAAVANLMAADFQL